MSNPKTSNSQNANFNECVEEVPVLTSSGPSLREETI